MFAPFDTDSSYKVCVELLNLLNSNKIRLTNTAKTKSTRDGHGIMLGALVAKKSPSEGSAAPVFEEAPVVLVTNSGIRYRLEGDLSSSGFTYVEPVVSASRIDRALNKNDAKIHELTDRIQQSGDADDTKLRDRLSKERSALCDESLKNVFALYKFACADKKMRSLNEICTKSLPPTGTGDCCAPKLLNYAYSNDLTPVSMCEVFYSNGDDSSKNGQIFDPCDERCGLILPHMLGLCILYRDNDIVVLNKQSGLLSVPGRGPDKQDCVSSRLRRLYPSCIEQPSVHRLDMETSGLMVYALNAQSQRNLRIQFEKNEVHKKYIALLDGVLAKKGIEPHGTKELFFRLDVDNRPHQIWDEVNGKSAVTEWQILNVETYTAPDKSRRPATRIMFIPHTGRTHQLRLISADEHGFGCPIIGDSLYGKCEKGERLMLHASELSFTHPSTGQKMEFTLPAPF
ncbi:MAG: RluA family pseudouridine synthase [Treponema sp.]|nr:RluA family pseudouridine synthase [Treponema sp.]